MLTPKSRALTTLSLLAPAKLNLFLHITGRRADGYHNLQSVFQLLDFGDTLSFSRRQDSTLQLHWTGPLALSNVPDDDNLVIRAARALQNQARCGSKADTPPDPSLQLGADITLEKHLPSGGGLGGGSSDAATTLLALNQLWQLDLNVETLAELGRTLGADVPVFVRGRSAWAEGIGDQLTSMTLPERWYLVVHPRCHVATDKVFSHPELTRDTPAITMADFFTGSTRNDFENLVRRMAPAVDNALKFLSKFGEARMTGSGASVFISFESEAEAREVKAQVPLEWLCFVARGINCSPTLESLAGRANFLKR